MLKWAYAPLNSSYAWLCVPIDYCDELSLVNLSRRLSMKLALISYWNDCNLIPLKSYENKQKKNQILKILRVPAIEWFQGRSIIG